MFAICRIRIYNTRVHTRRLLTTQIKPPPDNSFLLTIAKHTSLALLQSFPTHELLHNPPLRPLARSFKGVKSGKMAYSWANTRKKASKETVVSSHVGGAREVNAPLSMDSPCGSPAVLTPVQESAEEATTSLTNPFRRTKESSGEISQASSRASGALPSYSTSTGASESALGREGEAGSGAGATASRPASSSSGENPPTGSEVNNSVSKDSRGGVPPGSGTSTMVFARTPGGKSDVESRGTNPLYKSVAPFSRNGNGGAAATAPSSGKVCFFFFRERLRVRVLGWS